MQFDRNFVDELKARVKLSDIVGRKVRLIRRGREFVALSPFSNEKSPSFTINDDKGFYHCFSSGKSGDVITFLMETESLSFQEAVAKLASDLGIELPKSENDDVLSGKAKQDRRRSQYDVLQQAAAFFASQLVSASGAAARSYLDRRQVPPELRVQIGIGYAPASRTLLRDTLLKAGFTADQLLEAGLVIQPDTGGALYDRFRDRIMFPITDNSDRVIAFGGRAMSADAQAKYLNSPETPLFHKGNVLYNLANARRALQPARKGQGQSKDSFIVAEGYMDVVALTRAGFGTAVAPLGTALTEAQMALLWRYCPEPVLCFDGDAAGLRAMHKVVERALPLLTPGQSLRFVLLPDGLDPDDIISRQGPGKMAEYLAGPLPLADVLWSAETSRQPLDTPERKAGFEARMQSLLAMIGDPGVRRYYQNDMRQRIAALFRPVQFQGRQASQAAGGSRQYGGKWRNTGPETGIGPASNEVKRSPLAAAGQGLNIGWRRELVIVSGVLHYPRLLERHMELFGELTFSDPALDRLRAAIINLTSDFPDLESDSLRSHLVHRGFEEILDRVSSASMVSGDWFCGPGVALADAETGWWQTVQRHHRENYRQQALDEAVRALSADFSLENEQNLMNLQHQLAEDAESGLVTGFGAASGRDAKV
ncbi:MAG: DNA primase [Pseudomonadota bacterium]